MNFRNTMVVGAVLCCAFSTQAEESKGDIELARFAVSGDFGTSGLGASIWWSASERLTLTLGYGSLETDQDFSTDGVDYTGNIDFSNGYALLRWYPSGGNFNIASGAVKMNNFLTLEGQPKAGTSYEVDGVSYPATLVESILGEVIWETTLVPYFGLGWSKGAANSGWGSFLDLGVIQSGSPEVVLTATGLIADQPMFLSSLRAEEEELNAELDKLELFPVARLGLMYRF